jgi:hypothetical protein
LISADIARYHERMGRMIFDLTEADREALEALRIRMGLRSHAEVLRALIRGDDGEPALAPVPATPRMPRSATSVVAPTKRQRVEVVAPKRERFTIDNVRGPYKANFKPDKPKR